MNNKDTNSLTELKVLESTHESVHYEEENDTDILDVLQEGEGALDDYRVEDQERITRRPRLIKESEKYREVGKGDSRYVKLVDKKHVESGRVKGIHKRKGLVKKAYSYRTSESTRDIRRDSTDLKEVVGKDFGMDVNMKKSFRISERRKHLGKKTNTEEVIRVRVVGTLENESGRAVALGPLRGVLPVQQVCLPSILNKQDFMESMVGRDRMVKVMKPAGYDDPFIVSHREVDPSLLLTGVIKAYKNTKEFKENSRYFDNMTLKKFLDVLGAEKKQVKGKKNQTDSYEDRFDLLVENVEGEMVYKTYKKDFIKRTEGMIELINELPLLFSPMYEEEKEVIRRYINLYILITDSKKKSMEEVGLRGYEYMEMERVEESEDMEYANRRLFTNHNLVMTLDVRELEGREYYNVNGLRNRFKKKKGSSNEEERK